MVYQDTDGHTVVGPDPPGTHVLPGEAMRVKRERRATAGERKNQFKPGKSANPGGRPKEPLPLTGRLRKKVMEVAPPKYQTTPKERRLWVDILVDKLLADAMENPASMERVWDRIDGRVPTPVVGGGGGPVQVLATIQVVSDAAKSQLADVLAGKGTEKS